MAGSSTVERRPVKSQVVGSSPTLPAKSARKRETVEPPFLDVPSVAGDEKPASEVAVPEPVDIPDTPSPSEERLGVAKKALSAAEKQRRYREKKKSEDPDYLSREALRQRNRRKG